MSTATLSRTVISCLRAPATRARRERTLAQEAPLVIRVNAGRDYTLMRTPGDDGELVTGFLLTEQFIDGLTDLLELRQEPRTPNLVEVQVAGKGRPAPDRTLLVGSSCGLCGRTDIPELLAGLAPVAEGFAIAPDVLYRVPGLVREQQALFRATGATHAAALFDADGKVLAMREDIGRHCAFDKLIGHALQARLPLAQCGAFLSGRVSIEMIVKAARAGISLVAAVSAPTAAAVEAAERLGITLCGFARGEEFTVYAREDRIAAGR